MPVIDVKLSGSWIAVFECINYCKADYITKWCSPLGTPTFIIVLVFGSTSVLKIGTSSNYSASFKLTTWSASSMLSLKVTPPK